MKHLKKTVVFALLLCALVGGCGKKDTSQNPTDQDFTEEQTVSQTEGETAPSTEAPTDLQNKLSYYEKLVGELREELVDVKAELFASRLEYESRIAELEASKREEPPLEQETGADPAVEFSYLLENGAVTITAYKGHQKEVTVPAMIEGYPVYAIGERAFADLPDLSCLVLPSTVTKIGWFAFSGCVSLESVYIPETVEQIAYGAFQNCTAKLSIACISGSYAEAYAHSYGIRVEQK